MLPYLADSVQRFNNWQITFTKSHGMGSLRPLIVVSPIIAETLAKAGWSKLDVKRYVYEHARRPAYDFERQLREWNIRGVWKPEDYMIAVTGDPLRNNAYVFAHNAFLG